MNGERGVNVEKMRKLLGDALALVESGKCEAIVLAFSDGGGDAMLSMSGHGPMIEEMIERLDGSIDARRSASGLPPRERATPVYRTIGRGVRRVVR